MDASESRDEQEKGAPASSFADVFRAELTAIKASRKQRKVTHASDFDPDDPAEPPQTRADRMGLFGLAFSGGGVRSATFNLGVIQALAEMRLLRWVDYLSTVSGGGYIGSWLLGWIRARDNGVLDVERELKRESRGEHGGAGPRAVQFLRDYSNYLTPRRGMFGADTWTVVSTYFRNLTLMMVLLVATLMLLLAIPHVVSQVAAYLHEKPTLAAIVSAALLLVGFAGIGRWNPATPGLTAGAAQARIQRRIVLPVFAASVIGAVLLKSISIATLRTPAWIAGFAALVVGAWGIASLFATRRASGPALESQSLRWKLIPVSAAIAGVAGGALLYPLADVLPTWATSGHLLLVVGPPAVMLLYSLVIVIQIGFSGEKFSDPSLEWWSRLGAWLLIYSVAWSAVCAVAFYGPILVRSLTAPELWSSSLMGWLATSVGGIFAARSADPNQKPGLARRALVVVAPYVFIAGMLCLVGWLVEVGFSSLSSAVLFVIACAVAGLAFVLDINRFSMHGFYGSRLIRCYLGATNGKREPDKFTGFDPNDDFRMSEVKFEQGPYAIVNTAMNLVRGSKLAWQQRKASSFSFTPKYTGFEFPPDASAAEPEPESFRPTSEYRGGVRLGTCMAISGAAASPSMGYHSSPAMSFLLTMFNVRLGWWSGNPARDKAYKTRGPRFGIRYLIQELFGIASHRKKYVYLSDGGHFENLGIYELVRRRCRHIVVCDAGQDRGYDFDDLGNAIRKCRADFGVDIQLNVHEIRASGDSGNSKAHCAVGDIRYPGASPGSPESIGTIVYIKPSLSAKLPADILNYALRHPAFPHQSTADQWFDESQFESYRHLGYVIANKVFREQLDAVVKAEQA